MKLHSDFYQLAASLQQGFDKIQNPRIREALAETERELIRILGGRVRHGEVVPMTELPKAEATGG